MRRWVLIVGLLAAWSLLGGTANAFWGTFIVDDWLEMKACQCLNRATGFEAYNMRYSPDGTMLAYVILDELSGERALLIGETSAMESFTKAKYWAYPVSGGYKWSGDGRYVYYSRWDEETDTNTVWKLDIETGKADVFMEGRLGIHTTSPDGQWVVYFEEYPDAEPRYEGWRWRPGNIIAWNLGTNERKVLLTNVVGMGAAFSNRGDRIAVAFDQLMAIFRFDGFSFDLDQTLSLGVFGGPPTWDYQDNYIVFSEITRYRSIDKYEQGPVREIMHWVDINTRQGGSLWVSHFYQGRPYFIPGTRQLAFTTNAMIGKDRIPRAMVRGAKRLPPHTSPSW